MGNAFCLDGHSSPSQKRKKKRKRKKKDYSSATNLLHILNHLNCYPYNMSYYLQL